MNKKPNPLVNTVSGRAIIFLQACLLLLIILLSITSGWEGFIGMIITTFIVDFIIAGTIWIEEGPKMFKWLKRNKEQ